MSDPRSEPRSMCADMVGLHWRDKSGEKRRSMAMLDDISRSGASLQTDMPIPLGTILRIAYRRCRLEGSVRYCLFRDIGYSVGIQFAEDSKWSQQQFRPRHLLDLAQMAAHPLARPAPKPPDKTRRKPTIQ